jgi:hypothetical protein
MADDPPGFGLMGPIRARRRGPDSRRCARISSSASTRRPRTRGGSRRRTASPPSSPAGRRGPGGQGPRISPSSKDAYREAGLAFAALPRARTATKAISSRASRPVVAHVAGVVDAGGRVYLHCNAGYNRAPTVAIAFLTAHEGLSVDAARAAMRACRSCAPYTRAVEAFAATGSRAPMTVACRRAAEARRSAWTAVRKILAVLFALRGLTNFAKPFRGGFVIFGRLMHGGIATTVVAPLVGARSSSTPSGSGTAARGRGRSASRTPSGRR